MLARNGIDVTVLEARDRVGGRVWSRELDNGAVVELGAEFILPGNDTIRAYVARFGLGLWGKGMRYGEREPRGGIGFSAEALDSALAEIAAAVEVAAQDLTQVSASELLDGLSLDPGAREAVQARLEVSCAATADRVGASTLAGLAAHSRDESPSVAGGNQRIALSLAAELGRAVHLSSPVKSITWTKSGARVATADGEVEAARVVLAVPASVIGRIAFDPPLPEALHVAYDTVTYGNAAKLFVPLTARAQTSAVLSVPERYWTWTATGDAGVQPVVHAFAGSAPALARLEVAHGADAWLTSLARMRPDLSLAAEEAVLSTWDDDPWVGAAYSCAVPPTEAWQPAGAFHACGEHTAAGNRALMDSALASGVRVACEVEAVLARESL